MHARSLQCMHELVAAQAASTPDALAVIAADAELTYRELDHRANELAHRLVALGVGPETLVGLYLQRSPRVLVTLLGILKAGGAYVPLDPEWPRDRVRWVIGDTATSVVLTDARMARRLAPGPSRVVDVDADGAATGGLAAEGPPTHAVADNLVYCAYTSGSTGTPKGVAVTGRSLMNHALHIAAELALRPRDRVLQFTSIAIDAALEEIFPAWLAGAAVVVRPDRVPSAGELDALVRDHGVSVLSLPSAYWHMWVEELAHAPGTRPPALRLVFVGGDKLRSASLQQWLSIPWSREVRWVADYGPTEATISCALQDGARSDGHPIVPIGRSIPNVQIHVLDGDLNPVASGTTGELHIAGACLARGYWGRAELTAEAFVPNPFAAGGERMYRSGDLGYERPDGSIQFVGRTDRQVKVRGHRVEIAEVETALRSCEGVRDAAVTAAEDGTGGTRLTAYVVAPGVAHVAIRDELARALPAAMIPAAIVPVDVLPRTGTSIPGREATPALRGASNLERRLAWLFAEIAGRVPRSVEESFLSCGGDSLRAFQLLDRLADATGVELGYDEFVRAPTVRALARHVEARGSTAALGAPRSGHALRKGTARSARRSASDAQQRLWFLHKLHRGAPTYSMPFGYRLRGSFSIDRFDAALTELVVRHEALRTALVEDGGGLWQEIAAPLPVRSLRASAGCFEDALRAARDEARVPFDLTQAPLLRTLFIDLPGDDALLLVNVHHAVFDAWSLAIFWRELSALYAGTSSALQALGEPAFHYADYSDWQRQWLKSPAADRQLEFWRERLAGDPPVLRLNPATGGTRSSRCPEGAIEPLRINATARGAVADLAHARGTTDFVVLLAAFLATLQRHTLQDEVVVGVPAACRSTAEFERIIGYFANTVAIRIAFRPDLTFAELVDKAAATVGEAMANQQLPFNRVVDSLALPRHADSNPVFQAMFVLQSTPIDAAPEIPEVAVEEVTVHSGTAKVDLSCMLRAVDAGFEGELEYAPDVLEPAAAADWLNSFRNLLADAARRPSARIGELRLASTDRARALVARANDAFDVYPDLAPLHAAIEAHARNSPEAVAAQSQGATISYGDLNERANRLARSLISTGVGPERLVGVHIERSIDLVVGLIATLKAGAGFVPLDPALPVERIRTIAADAGLHSILTHELHASRLATLPARVIVEAPDSAGEPAPDPGIAVALDSVACVYYTSGSTGVPKGVVLSHRCVAGRLEWLARRYQLAAGDRLVHKTPLIFDVAIWEIFGPLAAGATILMAEPGAEADVAHVDRLLGAERTVFAHFVPSMLDAYLSLAPTQTYPDLRWVQVSGEAMPARLLEPFRERFGIELHNAYGQTETSEVAVWEGTACESAPGVPIGRQVGIYRVFVVDEALALVPPGVPGELCVAGVGGLARGYHGRPKLTAERFVPNPYAVTGGERLYRTGDLAAFDREGLLHYLGRVDSQVKIRGCRVEPGEVEAALESHPAVRAGAVVARADEGGQRELVAYVVADSVSAAELSAYVERFLPRYMLPATFVFLDVLPLTGSGKLDRLRLPAPAPPERPAAALAEPPATPLEAELLTAWRELLGTQRIARTESFFSIGGNSLKCLQILHRVNAAFDIDVSVRDFFAQPTIAGLAAHVEGALVAKVGALSEDEAEHELQWLVSGVARD